MFFGPSGSTWNGEWNKIRKEFAKLIWDQIVGLSSSLYMLTSAHSVMGRLPT